MELNHDLYGLALALLDKAIVEKDEDERIVLLQQASQLFRDSLNVTLARRVEPRSRKASG